MSVERRVRIFLRERDPPNLKETVDLADLATPSTSCLGGADLPQLVRQCGLAELVNQLSHPLSLLSLTAYVNLTYLGRFSDGAGEMSSE